LSLLPVLMATGVNAHAFYNEYHGHPVPDLEAIIASLRAREKKLIWTAGDSSLDNKFWFNDWSDAVNGYEDILSPARMKQDVSFWMNSILAKHVQATVCVNTAIEATSLNDRACGKLLDQDKLIHDNIGPDDYLVVSVGGNDVALQPLCCTVCSMLALVYGPVPTCCVRNFAFACPLNMGLAGECGCSACGIPNCIASFLCGCPIGYPYMVDMFKNRVGNYVRKLVSKTKPKKVVVCMIYYLDEKAPPEGSWADFALSCLCYNRNPARLQAGIEAAFRHGTKRIWVEGTEVIPFPLFEVLDGKTSSDYLQRVEPSPQGGHKMAAAILKQLLGIEAEDVPPQQVPNQVQMEP